MLKFSEIEDLYKRGFSLLYLPPKSKGPKGSEYIGWTTKPNYTLDELKNSFAENKNLAVRLGTSSILDDTYCLVAIDFDVKKNITISQKEDITKLLISLLTNPKEFPAVKSGSHSGSMHFYAKCPIALSPQNINIFKSEWGEIAIKGNRTLIVLPPSIHPSTDKPYEWVRSLNNFNLPDLTKYKIWEEVIKQKEALSSIKIQDFENRLILTDEFDIDELTLNTHLKELIQYGNFESYYPSPSEAMFAAMHGLVNAGLSNEAIVTIFNNPEYVIAESTIKKCRGSFEAAYRWLLPQIKKAYDQQITEVQSEFLDLLSDKIDKKKTDKLEKSITLSFHNIHTLDDIKKHPHSRWIIPGRFLEKQITITAAPGGSGKSAYSIQEAIAVALNKDLGVGEIRRSGNVLIYNTEDDNDEIFRRIYAICKHFKIHPRDLDNKLFLANTTNHKRLVLIAAESGKKPRLNIANIEHLKEEIVKNHISLCIIDPLVKFHGVNENDNSAMDILASIFTLMSQQTNVAFNLIHHTRKPGNGVTSAGEAEAIRGASALVNAARIAHTFTGMSKKDAENLGIEIKQRKRFVRLDSAKQNLFLDLDEAFWFEKVSVCLDNDPNQIESDWRCAFVPWNEPAILIEGISIKLADKILEFINGKFESEQPLTSSKLHPQYVISSIETQFDISEEHTKNLINYWKNTGQLELVLIDNHNKLKGYKVNKDFI